MISIDDINRWYQYDIDRWYASTDYTKKVTLKKNSRPRRMMIKEDAIKKDVRPRRENGKYDVRQTSEQRPGLKELGKMMTPEMGPQGTDISSPPINLWGNIIHCSFNPRWDLKWRGEATIGVEAGSPTWPSLLHSGGDTDTAHHIAARSATNKGCTRIWLHRRQ